VEVEELLEHLSQELRRTEEEEQRRTGSRFIGPGADPDLAEMVAAGGSYNREFNTVSKSIGGRENRGISGAMQKALAEGTGGSGGYLVSVETSSEILNMVRARSAVMRMGPRVVNVRKELLVNAISSGATAFYTAENAQIPVSEETFSQSSLLKPKNLAALVPVSNRLLRDAAVNPSVDAVIRQDLAEVLSLRMDLAFLRGTGNTGEPKGILNQSGMTAAPSLGNNGGTPSFDNLKDMVAAQRQVNSGFMKPAGSLRRACSQRLRRSRRPPVSTSPTPVCCPSTQLEGADRCSECRSRRPRKSPSTPRSARPRIAAKSTSPPTGPRRGSAKNRRFGSKPAPRPVSGTERRG
jgi:HK97 family phage major capsid protein